MLSGSGARKKPGGSHDLRCGRGRASTLPALRDVAFVLGMSALRTCFHTPSLAAEPVLVPFPHDFAESITATSTERERSSAALPPSAISRAAPGAVEASEWIKPGTNGLLSVLGVLADETTNTLYAGSFDASGFGVKVPTGTKPGALKRFDLRDRHATARRL